ncbi:MAG: signal peptidase I [Lachnospiraceae bacterium]|nr:signal peptidase I [Lachnospiraceae bacterium]
MSALSYSEITLETAELNIVDNGQEDLQEGVTENLFEDVDLERSGLYPDDDGSEWTAKEFFKEVLTYLLIIILSASVSYLLVTYVVQRTVVDGTSMSSTLSNGDNLLIDKISYKFVKPKRYDVVTFDYLYAEDDSYIKRIIGLPGESVQIRGGYVYIDHNDGNGYVQLTDDIYGNAVIEPRRYGIAASGVTLGEDEYFVMGDNRNNSHDSRKEDVGPVKLEQIEGKAILRIWPLSSFGKLKPQGKDY